MSALDKFWPRFMGKLKYGCQVLFGGNAYIGRGDEWPGAPDFLYVCEDINTADDDYLWAGSGGLMTRKLLIADKGDACDLGLRRAGPDNSKYNDFHTENLEDNARIGSIYSQTWGDAVNGQKYWTPRDGTNGWNVELAFRAAGTQNEKNRGGAFEINMVPKGSLKSVTRWKIDGSGNWYVNIGSKGLKKLTVDSKGYLKLS